MSMGRPKRSTPMRTYEYALTPAVQEGPEIPQCPSVHGEPLLSYEQPAM